MADKKKNNKRNAKQRKAARKRMRGWIVRVAVILLALSFLAFMIVSLFSAPRAM